MSRPPGAWPLRRRLVWGVAVLAGLAVLTAQVIGFVVLRSWLLQRVDQQLGDFLPPQKVFAQLAAKGDIPLPARGSELLPSDYRLTFYDSSGKESAHLGSGPRPGPRLASSVAELHLTAGHPVTVGAVSGGGHWRVRLGKGAGNTAFVVALPLDTVDGATSKLLWLDAVVLTVAVIALVWLGRWVVRIGLLPLTRVERTAQDITAGDLSLRLPDTDPRTEIGRLGTVLNSMLDRLQLALHEREDSEARLRRFVADAGHELRTPLTSVQGFAELTLRHPDLGEGERQEAGRLIVQNAERMSLLVDDLLLLAKLDQEPEYRQDRLDLLSLAADTVSAVALKQSGHPIRLRTLRPGAELDVVHAIGDEHRLRQVVANLLTNAVTHTPPDTPVEIRVGATTASEDSGGVNGPGRSSASAPLLAGTAICVIEVADQGPGLGNQDAERVFERFYRRDPSRSRDVGGSGLGLAIATAIAEGHGGRLELDTAPGRGCTFRLVLPAPRWNKS